MASIRRHPKSGRWQARYRDPSGAQRSKNFKRKIDAERFLATNEADKLRGEWHDPALGSITFDEMARRWQASRVDKARGTRDRDASYLRSMILPVFRHRSVASIRPSEVTTWLAELNRAPWTRVKAIQIFSSILEMARTDGAIKVNPAAGVKRPKQKARRQGRALSDAEVGAIIGAAENIDPNNAAMVVVMARMGLRVGEALALRREDIDLRDAFLTVRHSMSRDGVLNPPKGRAEGEASRRIPMPADVVDRLRHHLDGQGVNRIDGLLFVSPRGARLRYSSWRSRVWVKILETSSVDAVPHDLRHTVATDLFLRDRWTVPEVQAYMGHSDPKTTLSIYTHVAAHQLPVPSTWTASSG